MEYCTIYIGPKFALVQRLLMTSVLSCSVMTQAYSADKFWGGRSPGGGTFSDASRWAGNSVAGASDIAHFGVTNDNFFPFIYTVSFTSDETNQALRIEDDLVTFDLNGHAYTTTAASGTQIGTVSGRSGHLAITDGIMSVAFGSDFVVGASGSGFLTVSTGGLLIGDPFILVGAFGSGTLTVDSGGDIIADATQIGNSSTTTGTATITGAGSALVTNTLMVGNQGPGTLNIMAGGQVESNTGFVGKLAGSAGTANVTGANSKWKDSGHLSVGENGSGILSITAGGQVTSTSGNIGFTASSKGTVIVDGTNSKWTDSGMMTLASVGNGEMSITGGGVVQNTDAKVGVLGIGSVTVDGSSSQWTNSGSLFIGDTNTGTLTVNGGVVSSAHLSVGENGSGTMTATAGGQVTSTSGIIGFAGGSKGTVLVDGPNTKWIDSGVMTVAGSGNGELTITGGGVVQNTEAKVGIFSVGNVTVNGSGSQWTNSGALFIGDHATGTVSVNGGVVSSAHLSVGELGSGTMTVTGGGQITSTSGIVGFAGGSKGTVVVDGPNTKWIDSGEMTIASSGTGDLTITGGVVQNTNATVGIFGLGTVTVDGSNSQWTNSGALTVGESGSGTLTINHGGKVSNTDGFVARLGGNSNATVSGAGSAWTMTGRLSIGGDIIAGTNGGMGTLRIGPGASMNVGQDIAVFPGGIVNLEGGTLDTKAVSFQNGGAFNFLSGMLHVETFGGSLLNQSGTLAPGHSAGKTTVTGNYTQQSGARLEIEIGGTSAGVTHDLVNISGSASVGGQLQLAMLAGFVPSPSDRFTVLQAPGISGAFSNVSTGQRLMTIDGLGSFIVNYGLGSAFRENQIVLSNFLAVALPGDYNQNGSVDAADYVVWRKTLGQMGTSLAADGNGNGQIDSGDYNVWRAHFGQIAGSGSLANITIPEPAAFVILLIGAFALFTRQREAVS